MFLNKIVVEISMLIYIITIRFWNKKCYNTHGHYEHADVHARVEII